MQGGIYLENSLFVVVTIIIIGLILGSETFVSRYRQRNIKTRVEYEEDDEDRMLKPRIGEVMVEIGLITQEELEGALIEQEINRRKGIELMIGYQLVEMGKITNTQLIEVYREFKKRITNA